MDKKWLIIPGAVAGLAAATYGGIGWAQTSEINGTLGELRQTVLTEELKKDAEAISSNPEFDFIHSDDYYQSESYTSWTAGYMLTEATGDPAYQTSEIQDVKESYLESARNAVSWFPWLNDEVNELARYHDQEPVDAVIDPARDAFTIKEIQAGCEARAEGEEAEKEYFDERDAELANYESEEQDDQAEEGAGEVSDGQAVKTARWVATLYGMGRVCPS